MQWVAFILVAVSFQLMASKQYHEGWCTLLAACVVWALVALEHSLYGLLAQQVVLFAISIRGMRGTRR